MKTLSFARRVGERLRFITAEGDVITIMVTEIRESGRTQIKVHVPNNVRVERAAAKGEEDGTTKLRFDP